MEKTANIRIHWYDRDNDTDQTSCWTGVQEMTARAVSDILGAVEDGEERQKETERFLKEVGRLTAHYRVNTKTQGYGNKEKK